MCEIASGSFVLEADIYRIQDADGSPIYQQWSIFRPAPPYFKLYFDRVPYATAPVCEINMMYRYSQIDDGFGRLM